MSYIRNLPPKRCKTKGNSQYCEFVTKNLFFPQFHNQNNVFTYIRNT